MPEIFLFDIPTPVDPNLETDVESIRLYESTDGLSNWALVDSIAVSALLDDVSGKKRWESALSDASKFHMLTSVSVAGIEGTGRAILPPRGAGDLCTVFANTKELTGVAAEGVSFIVNVQGSNVVLGGSITSLAPHTFVTDAAGLVSFEVVKGLVIEISCETFWKRSITLDTTGLDTVNIATAISL
jgi:hypothetical protein